jgi:arylsulfatase A-like enzyme
MSNLISAPTIVGTQPTPKQQYHPVSLPLLVLVAAWFGIFAGILEGLGLLLFQRINWRRWGPMVHVSREIIWISPIVDVVFFVVVALIIAGLRRIFPRLPAFQVLVFVLTFLAIYDWLTLTERLYHRACLLLALGVAVTFTRWFQTRRQRVVKFWIKNSPWIFAAWFLVLVGMKGGEWLAERHQLADLPAARAGAPNVVVIVIDTLRADHLSAYEYTRATTPNFDRISKEGVLFQNAISACSWTLPSHASLLTGRYPIDHGMQNAQPMPWLGWGNKSLRGDTTLGEALERSGYRTGAFSANQSYFTSNVGLGRGFIHFEDYFQSPKDMLLRTLFGREFERVYLHRTERSKVTRAIRFLGFAGLLDNRKHAAEVNREALAWIDRGARPFFAFLNYIEVHDQAPPQNFHAPWGMRTEIDRYDAALNYDDSEVGNLMEELQKRGVRGNTLVIITSDHGESLGQHAMQFHGIALYREQIHVPLLIWYPGNVPAGVRVTRPVSNAAIASTVMDFVEAASHKNFPGAGLDALWTKTDVEPSWQYPLSELAKNEIVIDPDRQARNVEPTAMDGDMKSLVTPQWHFIVHQILGEQLYDWVHDPGELRNLINSPEGQNTVKILTQEIQKPNTP